MNKLLLILLTLTLIGGCTSQEQLKARKEAQQKRTSEKAQVKAKFCAGVSKLREGMTKKEMKEETGIIPPATLSMIGCAATTKDGGTSITFDANCKLKSWDYSRICG